MDTRYKNGTSSELGLRHAQLRRGKTAKIIGATLAIGLITFAAAAADTKLKATQILPSELKWFAEPKLPPGVERTFVWGDSSKPGLFTFRAKWPANTRVEPHDHPTDEYVTIISGTWYTASGDVFDESKLQPLPAGSFYFLPAGVKQYSLVKEPTVIQVTAMGPWGVSYKEK